MALPTLESDLSGRDLIRENTHSLVLLEANSLTKTLASPFAVLQDELLASLGEENKYLLAIARAEARARIIDEQIDALVDALKHALLVITGGDTAAVEYVRYFKEQPAVVKEPLLAEELDTVAAWVPSLKSSPHASLKEIGAKLEPLVLSGAPAMKDMSETNQALVDFHEVGARYALVHKMNATRKMTHGKLGEIVHDHPELGLATSFPDTFFLHDTRRRKKETPTTIDSEIAALKKRIAALEIKREKIVTILAAEKKADKKKKSEQIAKEIVKAEKAQAEAAAKLAALKAEADADGAEEP